MLYNELSTLKDSMMENLNASIERGGKIQVSLDRSESLVSTSKSYKRQARKVELEQRKRKYCIMFVCYLVLLVSFVACLLIAEIGRAHV